jgi:DNA-binding NarL/FixJ family response regulator
MESHTLLPLPHWVCTLVAVPRGARPLGHLVQPLFRGPLLAGGDTDTHSAVEVLSDQGNADTAPYTRMHALIAVAERHARTGDVTAEVTALDALRALCERLRGEALASDAAEPARPDGLTVREVEVLRYLANGKTIRQVAATLCLSPRTVERHITTIYRKIGARGRVDATAYAVANGLMAIPRRDP